MRKKEDFSALLKKAQTTEIKAPTQKVVPIIEKKETLFSLYIPDSKLHELKLKALTDKVSVKSLINEAIDRAYFST